MSSTIRVQERIAPEITASLFSNYRSSADAVMELVDNSVDSRIPGTPLRVTIVTRPLSLVVETEGGQGMGLKELERNYLRWGGSPKRGRNLIGQYGQGGKAAIGHLGTRFSVEASRPGDAVSWKFTDEDYRDRRRLKTYEVTEVGKRTDQASGYVRIRIDGVDKRIDPRRLQARLAAAYRPLLEGGDLDLTFNTNRVSAPPVVAVDRRDISVNAAGGRIKGWAGVAPPERGSPGWVPGLRCYRLGRLIAEGEFFGHPTPAQAPGMARLMGEVDLPHVPLTMNKSDFDRDSPGWVAVETRMFKELGPLARRLAREDEAPPSESALRAAEQVRKLLSQALRMTERADLFLGTAPQPKPALEAAPELALEADPEPPASREPRDPATPRPPASGPRRGFGSIVIRALDPSVRSTTSVEDGIRVVVINSEYPLFKIRRGDMWYQMETAAREICRLADSEDVPEYERRVSQILLTAVALRERRRPAERSGQLALLS